jgi:hypothetical protein
VDKRFLSRTLSSKKLYSFHRGICSLCFGAHGKYKSVKAHTEVAMISYIHPTIVKIGVGFGSALAMAVSFNLNHSILWAIFHGILSWIYVIYALLFRAY